MGGSDTGGLEILPFGYRLLEVTTPPASYCSWDKEERGILNGETYGNALAWSAVSAAARAKGAILRHEREPHTAS